MSLKGKPQKQKRHSICIVSLPGLRMTALGPAVSRHSLSSVQVSSKRVCRMTSCCWDSSQGPACQAQQLRLQLPPPFSAQTAPPEQVLRLSWSRPGLVTNVTHILYGCMCRPAGRDKARIDGKCEGHSCLTSGFMVLRGSGSWELSKTWPGPAERDTWQRPLQATAWASAMCEISACLAMLTGAPSCLCLAAP